LISIGGRGGAGGGGGLRKLAGGEGLDSFFTSLPDNKRQDPRYSTDHNPTYHIKNNPENMNLIPDRVGTCKTNQHQQEIKHFIHHLAPSPSLTCTNQPKYYGSGTQTTKV
jgi:hypothetical protein